MACGCGNRNGRRQVQDAARAIPTAGGTPAGAAQAAASVLHEVVDARGNRTGRKFSSLTAAASYANRIGGTTVPVT